MPIGGLSRRHIDQSLDNGAFVYRELLYLEGQTRAFSTN